MSQNDTPFAEFEESLDIAVVGMSGRFPRAADLGQYWRNLRDGRCSVTFFEADELIAKGIPADVVHAADYVRAGNPLEDSDKFDAEFFGYSPREAELMDPQHRVLLECAWAAMEDAGHDPARFDGLTGVYAGSGTNTYLLYNVGSQPDLLRSVGGNQVLIGNNSDFLATKISYKLGLEGPSVNVQSACSTSLVAVCLACQALQSFQCDAALAGGVAVGAGRDTGYHYVEDGIFSPDGHCRSFDADAKGTVAGDGVGVVVLKRLYDALVDGDNIRALIKGTALNNDGARRAGFTAPGVDSQALVITTALANADVDPATVGYVEGHGTATILGDPIEFAALKAAFTRTRSPRGNCALGSVKTNIGHLDAAAGIAGLIKTVLAVQHGEVPPILHFTRPNPRIDLDDSPFFVNTERIAWPVPAGPRRAGVSSFGLGGTNAHVVLEQAPPVTGSESAGEQLIVLSAKSQEALEAMTERLGDHLDEHPGSSLADIAFTLQNGRKAFSHRRMLVGTTVRDVREALAARDDGRLLTGSRPADGYRPVVFMFAGFGEQFPGMAAELYEREPDFRAAFDRCADIVERLLDLDLREVVFDVSATPPAAGANGFDLRRMVTVPRHDDHPLNEPVLGYPAIFAVEYALVELWRSWGVVPSAMVGHSLGEYVAACVAGVFSLEDALSLVVERARLICEQREGAMLAVPLPEQDVARFLDDEVTLAAVNDSSTCVLSGTSLGIEQVAEQLTRSGVVSRQLPTRFGFHSPLMDPVVDRYAEVVRGVTANPPKTRFVSNVTGDWITPQQATDPRYWARHLREPVRFVDGLATLWAIPDAVFVEIGPGRALSSAALRHPASATATDRIVLTSLSDPFAGLSDRRTMLRALGQLWLAGIEPHWHALHTGRRLRVPLPSYPFTRRRHWLEPGTAPPSSRQGSARLDRAEWFYETTWQRMPAVKRLPDKDLSEHRWLVFADEQGFGDQVAARLAACGAAVVRVSAGTRCRRTSDTHFEIDPHQEGHYPELADALRAAGLFPDRVVHCWSASPSGVDELTLGFHSLVRWARASEPELMAGASRWDVISTRAYDVLGGEPVNPLKAMVHGVCRVAAQEYPGLRCTQIDLPPTGGDVDAVVAELAGPPDSQIVAVRGAHRWQRQLVAVPPPAEGDPRVRPGGVYLITGGLGKIGLVMARSLAEAAKVRLVLVGRTGLPSRDSWDDSAHPPETAAATAAVRDVEALGSEVLVCAADVADVAGLEAVVGLAERTFGPVNGVVHAAGATGPSAHRVLADLTAADCEPHFRAKVHGTVALDRVLSGRDLDFALLCSSIASVIGGLGFTAYAAANAFLDAYAHRREPSAIAWTSVNWEAWRFGESDAGPGIGAAVHSLAVSPGEGRWLFERVLSGERPPQVITSTSDLATRARLWADPVASTRPVTTGHTRPNLRNPYVAPASDLERRLVAIWQALLGMDGVGVHDNFFELGGSSLLGLQVVHQLRTELRVAVPLTVVYEGPTIRSLAALIDELERTR